MEEPQRTAEAESIETFEDRVARIRAEVRDIVDTTGEQLAREREGARLRAEKRAKKRKRSKAGLPLAIAVAVFAGSSFYCYFGMMGFNKPEQATPEEIVEYLDGSLYLVQLKIGGYRDENGRYPHSLTEIHMGSDRGLTYTLHSDTRYSLEYSVGGVVRTYTSDEDPDRLMTAELARVLPGVAD
jgi:hypothetical protein